VRAIHIADPDTADHTCGIDASQSLCGVRLASGNFVPLPEAKRATCKRCQDVLVVERTVRGREVSTWTLCEDTGELALPDGTCPVHGEDRCLIEVGWVDRSHVRKQMAPLRSFTEWVTSLDGNISLIEVIAAAKGALKRSQGQ
jgi:hypothetical protein